jgi:hypothetical protein
MPEFSLLISAIVILVFSSISNIRFPLTSYNMALSASKLFNLISILLEVGFG